MFWTGIVIGAFGGAMLGFLTGALMRVARISDLEQTNELLLRRRELERKRWRSIVKRLRAQQNM
jgi:hypothetical protein